VARFYQKRLGGAAIEHFDSRVIQSGTVARLRIDAPIYCESAMPGRKGKCVLSTGSPQFVLQTS